MAKMIEVSKAEHEMLVAAYSQDGLTIAKLEAELAQAKEDIRQMLNAEFIDDLCKFCRGHAKGCCDCKKDAEWRGYQKGV